MSIKMSVMIYYIYQMPQNYDMYNQSDLLNKGNVYLRLSIKMNALQLNSTFICTMLNMSNFVRKD